MQAATSLRCDCDCHIFSLSRVSRYPDWNEKTDLTAIVIPAGISQSYGRYPDWNEKTDLTAIVIPAGISQSYGRYPDWNEKTDLADCLTWNARGVGFWQGLYIASHPSISLQVTQEAGLRERSSPND